jgi:phosphonate transport system substrate-binding protein
MKRAFLLLMLLSLPVDAKRATDYSVGICVRELDWSDLASAQAAAKHLFDHIASKNKFTYKTHFMSRSIEVVRLVEEGKVNVGWLLMSDYVKLERKHKLRLLGRPLMTGRHGFRLKLLVPRGSKTRKLSQLRGRTISIHRQIEINQVYLETLVAREGLGRPADFFAAIKERKKAKSAVVDLLLGEVDACLVADIVLDTMAELNPQVKKKLRVLHTSPRYTYPPMFGTSKLDTTKAERLTRTVTSLHETPEGKQLLLLFRVKRFVRATSDDYRNTRELLKEHDRHMKRATRARRQ